MPPVSSALVEEMRGRGLISIQAAAALAKRHPSTIRSWLASGKLRGAAAGGTSWVMASSLDELMAVKPLRTIYQVDQWGDGR